MGINANVLSEANGALREESAYHETCDSLPRQRGGAIVWKDFGVENNCEENIRLEEYEHIGPYTFNWKPYESALLQAVDNLKQA